MFGRVEKSSEVKWSEASQFNSAAAEDGGANSVAALGLLLSFFQ